MKYLDFTNRKILHKLDINARAPLSRISKDLSIGRDATKYRINKLEKEGVILGYKTLINFFKLGYKCYRVYFKFYSISKDKLSELITTLSRNNRVFWMSTTDGFIDIIFGAWFKNEIDFHKFYTSLIKKFRPVIKREYVNNTISYTYLNRAYLLDKQKPRKEFTLGNPSITPHDQTDIEILKMLSSNARTPLINISKKLNLESATIIYRIKQLEKKGVIIGYRADINLNKIEREFYSVKLYLSDFKRKKEIEEYLRSINYVVNFTEAIGSWDVEFDLEVDSTKEYKDLIFNLKEKYPEISDTAFFRTSEIFKIMSLHIFPEI